MRIETLVATVGQKDRTLANRMNIQTDAIIGNQIDDKSTDIFFLKGKKITYLNTAERGVGRNRNLIFKHASADICVFADDDMRFIDGYPQVAEKAFQECPDGDILIFNLIEKNPRRYINIKIKRVGFGNYAKYGAARIALRRETLALSGIRFNLSFGGGAKYGSGEDTIFLHDCLKHGMKIYAVPYALAEIDQEAGSSWFRGYNKKFFHDKGALYACIHPVLWLVYILRFLLRYRHKYKNDMPFTKALQYMKEGGKEYRLLQKAINAANK